MKKLFAAGICFALGLGLTAGAFAQTVTTTTTTTTTDMDPNLRSTIGVDIIEETNSVYADRIQSELVERPAPQVGQTRAAIEAIYGPAHTSLAPNKPFEIYTNEHDLVGGKMFSRQLTDDTLRVYEVSYGTTNGRRAADDRAVDVKLRVIPRVGDHKNLVTKLMGEPISEMNDQRGQHVVYGIPKHRYVFYTDVVSNPFEAINTFYNTDGFLVGQEFMPSRYQGQHTLTSAGRYVEVESKWGTPDRKVAW